MSNTIRVLEWEPSGGFSVTNARKATVEEEKHVVDWFKPLYYVAQGDWIYLEGLTGNGFEAVMGKQIKAADSIGSFMGTNNYLFPITPEQEQQLIATANAEHQVAKEWQAKRDQDDVDHFERLSRAGLCPKCLSFCYGDCDAN